MIMNSHQPIVIIGSGLAGYTLVKEIRKLNKTQPIVVLTRDEGAVYSKPMLSTGLTKQKAADGLITGDANGFTEQQMIEVRSHTVVTAINPEEHSVLLGDEKLTYSKLVLAWGADVIRLPIPGPGKAHIYSVNDIDDYRRFRHAIEGKRKVLIMGSGLIGCEFANDLLNGGYEVEVVSPTSMAFEPFLPDTAASAVTKGLEKAGVHFHFGTQVDKVEQEGNSVKAYLANGEVIVADAILSAVGLRPRTQLAEEAGIEVGRGIIVNKALETSAEDVYALGDCANVNGHCMMYVLPLMACARALAKTLTTEKTEVSYSAMPVVTKTPACPAVIVHPPIGIDGEWQFEEEGEHVKGLYIAQDGTTLGYVLTGDRVSEKQSLNKLIPPLF
jgi:rubredoxin-NAD+ reductase